MPNESTEYPGAAAETRRRKFAEWLRHHRYLLNKTQKEIARDADIHIVQYGRIENAVSGTKRETVIALANALGADVKEALEMAGFFAPVEKSANEITLDLPYGVKIMGLDEDFDEDDLKEIRAIMELKLKKNRSRKLGGSDE